ncbi:hypothetical protein OE88DRAFT_556201 [Heliocybe sulcata]|uniref:Uncharacterized protein n=1 Tax=Heliocybe sulcata TaxID=5364 RepID=A0A5C3MT15_9AGAM|nr:hypothetical protein OE88DRAFT_556201 [Heliocybe sulcata]
MADLLPVELVSKIFLLSLDSERSVTSGTPAAPWNAAQVCQYWRSVALAMPELWTSLSLDVEPGCHGYPKLIAASLARAQGRDLSVTLSFSDGCDTAACLVSLHAYSANLKQLRIFASDDCIHLLSLEGLCALQTLDLTLRCTDTIWRGLLLNPWHSITLPTLEHLRVRYDGCCRLFHSITLPKLQSLNIGRYGDRSIPFPTSYKPLASSIARSGCSLRRLVIERMPLDLRDLVECMKRSPSLTELSVGADEKEDTQLTTAALRFLLWDARVVRSGRAVLPNLRSLTIMLQEYAKPQDVNDLLRSRLSEESLGAHPALTKLLDVNITRRMSGEWSGAKMEKWRLCDGTVFKTIYGDDSQMLHAETLVF